MLADGDFDCLIGFGGGSPIDTAKAMAILPQGRGPDPASNARLQGRRRGRRGALPVIAIPTTAGTGSEATRFTVITDTERGEKMLIAGLGALPLAAIVDYELTFTVPPADHRRYRRRQPDPRAGGLCLAPRQPVFRHPGAGGDGADRRQSAHRLRRAGQRRRRGKAMMLGAMQAGIAFSNSSVALVHGMSRPIGAHFHVPHGLSNAMLLPAITRFGLEAAEGALRRGGAPDRLRARRDDEPDGGRNARRGPGGAEPGPRRADARRASASTSGSGTPSSS